MAVIISSVDKKSPAFRAKIKSGQTLLSINGHEIVDVLDYRFYQNDEKLILGLLDADGKESKAVIKKQEYEEIGLQFETYLMDKQHSCKNKCVFCFIDQLPRDMRKSLYFKDDDSRLSFLFGNYITLTNITEHEIERIIKMHISPVNISVHTTNPELRVRMMKNKFAGDALQNLWRLCDANVDINCQLVLCRGYNDGEELEKTLQDLICKPSIKSIACVPVGLTGHRAGLEILQSFDKRSAAETIDIIDKYGEKTVRSYGERRCFAADEFYLLSGKKIPDDEFYGEYAQLENGVGLWRNLEDDARIAVEDIEYKLNKKRTITSVTGTAAYPLIVNIVDNAKNKWHNLSCEVIAVENKFFGGKINVAGLVTGGDIIATLRGKNLGEELLLPAVMLRRERDKFLDDITIEELESELGVSVRVTENDGYDLIEALLGIKSASKIN
ncbi:MAG: DUF512 domain-containing protein [Oscillospiraceae bacterium]